MFLIFIYSIIHTIQAASSQTEVDDFEFESDLTPHTFFELSNGSKDYKPFNLTEFELASRKQMHHNLNHAGSNDEINKACYYLATTYRSALFDIRKYFPIRYLYVHTLDYEIGYLTHEIVSRYQTIIELYHLIQRRFEKIPERHNAPASYMLYIYMNILEQSKVILHLCNMLHELPLKYKKPPQSIFNDRAALTFKDRPALDHLLQQEAHERRLERERKERAKERRKIRKQNIAMGLLKVPVYTRQPKKSGWPKDYGWSIELWW